MVVGGKPEERDRLRRLDKEDKIFQGAVKEIMLGDLARINVA
jgi:hypothetical protein